MTPQRKRASDAPCPEVRRPAWTRAAASLPGLHPLRRLFRKLSATNVSPGLTPVIDAQALRMQRGQLWRSPSAATLYHEATRTDTPEMAFERDLALSTAAGLILEAGAGTCRITSALASQGHRVIATDISAEMLGLGLRMSGSRFGAVRASAFTLPFADDAFDTVIAYWLLLHFADWEDILTELLRVARPGALIVFERQNDEHLAKAEALAPAAPFLDRLKEPAGFQSFASLADVERIAGNMGATVLWARHYAIFADNLVARALLTAEYETWAASVGLLIRKDVCRDFWQNFEERHLPSLPTYVGRKQACVLRKGPAAPPGPFVKPLSGATPVIDADTRRSWELFVQAFSPVCPVLTRRPHVEQWA